MKAGSSLNPYAASYVPISKRGVVDDPKAYELTAKDSKGGKQPAWLGHHPGVIAPSPYQQFSQNYDSRPQFPENSKLKGHNIYVSPGSSSQNRSDITGKQAMNDDFDMDLAYLQMTFPGISDDSLSDAYMANKGDLEATLDMINELESTEDSLDLPDTLDIGDVPEGGSSSEPSSLKMKNVAAEVGGSSGS